MSLNIILTIGLTITLTFLRSVSIRERSDYKASTRPDSSHEPIILRDSVDSETTTGMTLCSWLAQCVYDCMFWSNILVEEPIDTKAPLELKYCEILSEYPSRHPSLIIYMSVDHYLCLDLLSVHVIRHINGNTIISLHPDQDLPTTRAEQLHDRIQLAGQSLI